MYIMPEMIELGLEEGQKWPNETYKIVAQSVGLCNPHIATRGKLMDVVQAILKIPQDKIKIVTLADLMSQFKVPLF